MTSKASVTSSAFSSSSASCYRKVSAEWKKHDTSSVSTIQPPRSGHVSFETENGDVCVFGGYAEVVDNASTSSSSSGSSSTGMEEVTMKRFVVNDLWKWSSSQQNDDNKKKKQQQGWQQVQTTATSSSLSSSSPPNPRLVSACAVINKDTVALFGGWDPQTPGTGGIILDDVHMLNLQTMEWTELPESCKIPDGPTSRHVVVTIPRSHKHEHNENDAELALLHNHRCIDHVLLFDLSKQTWKKQRTNGDAPSPKGLHAAAVLPPMNEHDGHDGSAHVVFFGGAAQDGTMSNEVHVLNTSTWTWTKIDLDKSSAQPSPRASPCLCALKDGRCIVYGGAEFSLQAKGLVGRSDLWLLTLDISNGSGKWELLLDDDGGGSDEDATSPDFKAFPPGRNAATLNRIVNDDGEGGEEETFLLSGGWAPFKKTWNDIWTLHIRPSEN